VAITLPSNATANPTSTYQGGGFTGSQQAQTIVNCNGPHSCTPAQRRKARRQVRPVVQAQQPSSGSTAPQALFEGRGPVDVEGSYFEFSGAPTPIARSTDSSVTGKGDQIISGVGQPEGPPLGVLRNDGSGEVHVIGGIIDNAGPFPSPDGSLSTKTNAELATEAREMAVELHTYEMAHHGSGNPSEEPNYYASNYADKALELSSEILHRIGSLQPNYPSPDNYMTHVGSGIVRARIAAGPFPLTCAANFLLLIAGLLPP